MATTAGVGAMRPMGTSTLQMTSNRVGLGAGCYWGTEKFIKSDFTKMFPGTVKSGAVGFMNPSINAPPNPTYRQVCSGTTGFVETYDCEFDGKPETFEKLVKHFFTFHDPTTLNRQGNDAGTQYGSVIFCYDEGQQQIASKVKADLQALIDTGKVRYQNKQVTTAIVPATKFYPAQDDHQEYLSKNPWGYCNHAYRFKLQDVGW